MNSASDVLHDLIASTLYIGPARARSERYYRYQDLSVSQIDADGKNFSMFLNSLRPKQMQGFSSWVESTFGYGVTISNKTGHISINLSDDSGEVNVVDTGYGVSQILPVLGQIWWAVNRPKNRLDHEPLVSPIILIEQPELHLHPAHQALLADTFVSSIRMSEQQGQQNPPVNFVVETHSETLVNRIGQLIAEKKFPADHVQILVFEPTSDNPKAASVRIATYDASGFLQNWPYGFFDPSL